MLESRSLKSIAATAALGASIVIGVARRAEAQVDAGTTSGAVSQPLAAGDFFIAIDGPDGARLGISEVSRFFNQARCQCQTAVGIYVALLQSGVAKRGSLASQAGTVSLVLGPGCKASTSIAAGLQAGTCKVLDTQSVQTFLDQAQLTYQTDARQLSVPYGVTAPDAGSIGACESPNGGQFTQVINVNFDFDGDGVIDLSLQNELLIDLAPPPVPPALTIQTGGEALVMGWDAVDASDLQGYQILCSRADQYQVFRETPTSDGLGATGDFTAAFSSCPSARSGSGVEGMDPTFVCSPLLAADTVSARVAVLQNGITYAAGVVAVDESGNATLSSVAFGTPSKTASFYDTYREGSPPGAAAGGLCAVGPGRPRSKQTLGGLSLVGAGAAGLLVRRRRRRS